MSFDLPPDALDRNLVFDFFWKFSVFECALKRGGFLDKQSKYATADWAAFGGEVHEGFVAMKAANFQIAVNRINKLNPKCQMRRGEQLSWEPVTRKSDESDTAHTLKLLKTVRNNLFHGGKYPDGPAEEVARDREILQAALTILECCYELHPGIKGWIEEAVAA
ncbi:MAG TPA: hypothetical protein VII58_09915 [Acidobacteriaceae bacterium]